MRPPRLEPRALAEELRQQDALTFPGCDISTAHKEWDPAMSSSAARDGIVDGQID